MHGRCVTAVRGILCLAVLPLASCSKLSDVGEQEEPTPLAVATTIGEPYTTSNGVMTTTVRSGADVLLTGKESQKGAADSGVPLIEFVWTQIGGETVDLIDRTNNTVSFTAPQVSQDTTLRFRLTVRDAKSAAASTEANVIVKPTRDGDHFLDYVDVIDNFTITAATSQAVAADAAAGATATLPFVVTVTKLVSFTDRSGLQRNQVPVGTATTLNGGWTTRAGAATGCSAPENPTLQVLVPRLNLDDKLADGSGRLSDFMEAADVDKATVYAKVSIQSSAALPSGVTPLVCAGTATPAAAEVVVDAEVLMAEQNPTTTPRDSKAAAQAYFNTIDPLDAKTTFEDWLDANGFDSTVAGWNADAHAVYTNNYDLGFGRDMYMKIGNSANAAFGCDSGAEALPLKDRIGKCDVAAVVVNYSGVEAAAKGVNAILAVAMEYSRSPGVANRFVKFYTFAPDTRDGRMKRVISVNLDRRGEKFMPQSCVVCHGGAPGRVINNNGTPNDATDDVYSGSGNVSATFLPWDLDSFLYSDTDPGFSAKSRNADLRAQYTRAAQATQFKRLNEGAYLTYADPVSATAGRFALARELLEGWYGGAGLPNATFDGAFTPAAWTPAGADPAAAADDNPADSQRIYHDVFARNCRACHIMQVPTTDGSGNAVRACVDGAAVTSFRNQVQMGCYREFAFHPDLAERLSRNQMPFARRTSDRMWAQGGSAPTVGADLQAYLLSTHGLTVSAPGTVSACIDDTLGTAIDDQGVTKYRVPRNAWVNLASACSRFVDTPDWTLSDPSDQPAPVVGAKTRTPRFFADKQGDYTVTLADASGASASVIAQVETAAPVAASGAVTIPLLAATGTSTIDVRDLTGTAFSSRDAVTAIVNVAADAGLTVVTRSTDSTLLPTQMRITTNSLSTLNVRYGLQDEDGDVSNEGLISVTGSGSLSVTSIPVQNVSPNQTGRTISVGQYISNPAQLALTYTFAGFSDSTTEIDTGLRRTLTFSANWYPTPPTVGVADATRTQTLGFGKVRVTNAVTGQFSYDAPPRTVTHSPDDLQLGPFDGFSFQACFTGQPQNSSNCVQGQVQIKITAAQRFSDVRTGLLNSTCSTSGCHGGPATPTGANLLIRNSDSTHDFYCRLRGLSATGASGNETANTRYIDLLDSATAPTSSLIYTKPSGGNGHGGGAIVSTPFAAILAWINEGAYYTPGATQSCP